MSLYLCHSRTTGPCTVSRPVQCVLYFRLRLFFPTDKPYKLVAGQIVLDTQALFKNSLDGIEFSRRDYIRAGEKKWFFFFTQHSTHLKKPASLANAQTCNSNDTDTGHAHPANSAYVCVCVCVLVCGGYRDESENARYSTVDTALPHLL